LESEGMFNNCFLSVQSNFSNVVIREGAEPENFFWVALGGRAPYETVSASH